MSCKKQCKQKPSEIERGLIRLKLRWFDQNNDDNIVLNTVDNYHQENKISHLNIPRPVTYEELQQQLALIIPISCGIAVVERPDGTLASAPYEDGEIILCREIQSLRHGKDLESRVEGSQWEEESYRKSLTLPPLSQMK